jgi:hypothetical protein
MNVFRTATPEDYPGGRDATKSQQEERQDEIEEHVVALLNIVVVVHPITEGDGFGTHASCEMCGLWDDIHQTGCPVPTLEDWLQSRN